MFLSLIGSCICVLIGIENRNILHEHQPLFCIVAESVCFVV